MMKTNINLLDLDYDILNIIGDFVKKDNNKRIRKEHNFNKTDFIMDRLKEKIILLKKKSERLFIVNYLKIVIQKKKLMNI